jgi:calcineurin-like phosphoesterase family protein
MEYVISDLHGNHTKLRERTRTQFKTNEEMSEHIVSCWNKTVSKNDIVYLLGDVGDKKFIEKYIPQLRGTIALILGNHDGYSKTFYRKHFDYVYNKPFWLSRRILLSHYPQPVEDGKINIHGHTHDISLSLGNYFNVSVDVVDYTPVKMKRFYDELGKINKPNCKFMYEWYAKYQIPVLHRDKVVLKKNGLVNVNKSRRKLYGTTYDV